MDDFTCTMLAIVGLAILLLGIQIGKWIERARWRRPVRRIEPILPGARVVNYWDNGKTRMAVIQGGRR